MEGNNAYDSSSIAAQSKREQFMKEAEEYRLRRHIAALQKLEEVKKETRPRNDRRFGIPHAARPHARPAH